MSNYHRKVIKIKSGANKAIEKAFSLESFHTSKELENIKLYLLKNIDEFVENNWGKFGKDFIIHHILKAERLKLLYDQNRLIAFAAASFTQVRKKRILYLEFTAVNPEFRGYNISTILNGEMISDEILKGWIKHLVLPLDVITITRNPRILGALDRFASSIYPSPKEFKEKGTLDPANDETWNIAQDLLKKSWNPNRNIAREGLVLMGSYENTPWLILSKTDRHYREEVRNLFEKYIELKKGADKEFIVHAKFYTISALKFNFWKRTKLILFE